MTQSSAFATVDSHLHVVSTDTTAFPRQPRGVGRDWWTSKAVDADAIGRTIRTHGVNRGVIVQAVGPYFTDNRYARAVVESDPNRYALVVAIDASRADGAECLAAEVALGSVAGVRLFAAGGDASWLLDGRGTAVWDAAHEVDISLVVACLAEHLPALAKVIAQRPDVVVALDHCAFAPLDGGPPYRAAAELFALAELPAVHLKVSTNALEAAVAVGSAAAFVDHAVEAFGADRLAWGSDHPQSYETTYAEKLGLARNACSGLSAEQTAAFFGDTAARLWFS
jgi:L-fuconolactonase